MRAVQEVQVGQETQEVKRQREVFFAYDGDGDKIPHVKMTVAQEGMEPVEEAVAMSSLNGEGSFENLEESADRLLLNAATCRLRAKPIAPPVAIKSRPPLSDETITDWLRQQGQSQKPPQIPLSIDPSMGWEDLLTKLNEMQHLAYLYRTHNSVHESSHDEAIEWLCTAISRDLNGTSGGSG